MALDQQNIWEKQWRHFIKDNLTIYYLYNFSIGINLK